MGAAVNAECKIDSLPQSWSVLSGAGDPERSLMAMDEVYKRLVNKENNLVQLFTPAFDKSAMDPGYIRGYVPGVRENGGQYTHAAVWVIMALAVQGDSKRAWELLKMINPINHGSNSDEIATYNVEPYVICADVYTVPRHAGRGGWTWYTGSAGWYYRLIIEYILGLKLEGDVLHIVPCIPEHWDSFKVVYYYKDTPYHITVSQTAGAAKKTSAVVDGQHYDKLMIPLKNDGLEHKVDIMLTIKKQLKYPV